MTKNEFITKVEELDLTISDSNYDNGEYIGYVEVNGDTVGLIVMDRVNDYQSSYDFIVSMEV